MAPSVESSSSASSSSDSSSGSGSSSDSLVERNVQGSLACDVENRSLERGSGEKEDSIGSTGRKGNKQNDPPHASTSGQSEDVSIAVSEVPLKPLPSNCSFYLGRSKVTHMLIQEYMNKGYLRPETASTFRPPGNEVVPGRNRMKRWYSEITLWWAWIFLWRVLSVKC